MDSNQRRRLGLPSAVALIVANMIGAGVFTTSGFALGDLGSRGLVLMAWFVAGLLAMAGALSYGALARRMPESGGEYHFLSKTIHPLVGFLAGWVSLLAGFTAPIAVAALGLQAYLSPLLGEQLQPEWIGTTAIILAAFLHGLRFGPGVMVQNFAVALKLMLILVFVALGASQIPSNPPEASTTDAGFQLGVFAISLVWISYSYSGWNAAVYVAGEVKNPQRNLNRSLWLATALVMTLYLAMNAVFVFSAPVSELAGKAEVGAVAAQALGGDGWRNAMSLLVALALFTSVSSMMMAGPRVYARMAEDGLFPRRFAPRDAVPRLAVALQAALAIIVVWVSNLRELLGFVGFTLLISAAATVIGLFVLRRREGPEKVPVPGFPWIPGLYVLTTLGATGFMVVTARKEAYYGLLTVAAGLPVYFILRAVDRRARKRRHA